MVDVTIIGAGVIGCAIARELSRYELDICVIDKESDVASGTSKANSAIVHAGFDAKPSSVKGQLNARGNEMFDQLSKELDFPFKRNGSLVLSFDEAGIEKLHALRKQGEENGVPGLRVLSKEEVKALEPNLSDKVTAALFAPTGGIVCPYEMTLALAENAHENGVMFKLGTEVQRIDKKEDKFYIQTTQDSMETKIVINAAGIFSDDINNMISEQKIHIVPRKGEYCLFDKAVGDLVSKTIFQLPTHMGKGVLVTPTVDGNLLVGPNAIDVEDKADVTTTKAGLDDVLAKARLSLMELQTNQIITSFSGLRAHSAEDDFILGEAEDVKNFINAAGIESPGLSSAPSIAESIAEIIVEKLQPQRKESFNPLRKGIMKFREMSNEERKKLIAEKPQYGKIICRCEMVTEGEILEAIHRPLGAVTLDAVKRRTRAGMGRCQAGFCSTRIVDILSRELQKPRTEITKFGGKSKILISKNKEGI